MTQELYQKIDAELQLYTCYFEQDGIENGVGHWCNQDDTWYSCREDMIRRAVPELPEIANQKIHTMPGNFEKPLMLLLVHSNLSPSRCVDARALVASCLDRCLSTAAQLFHRRDTEPLFC